MKIKEAKPEDTEKVYPRLTELALLHEKKFGTGPVCNPNPYITETPEFCDYLEKCIKDGVEVTREVITRDFELTEAAWTW
jgi:hypothetical protein